MAQAGLIRQAPAAAGLVLAVAGLAACAQGASPATSSALLAPIHVAPGSLLLPAVPVAPPRDTCGAAALSALIGKARSQIPVAVDLSRRRVSCTACPVAPDVRLDRVNILYDARTGLVTRIVCG